MAVNVAGTSLHVGDIVVIVVYFAFVLFVGLWTSQKNRGSAGGYFLAGRNMNWVLVGASLFASNVGSIHFVALVGSGAASGIAIALYELNAMYVLMILAYIFLPVYMASGIFTMPEYLQHRFGGKRIQIYIAVLALLMYIFTKISTDLYAGAVFIEQSLHWNIYWSMLLLLSIAAIFTITGGLTAVIWTDFIQTVIMIIGALVIMVLAFVKVGGFSAMIEKYPVAISNYTLHHNKSCGEPREDYMHFFRDPVNGDLPWPGILGMTVNSIWYWCSDQVIVQRALAGKTYGHAKAGTILCAYIKILPLFLMVFPGMIARILYPETVGCADPVICKELCGSETGCSNIAYPSLVIDLMPPGARGVMLAVMLAASMSSLTSIFNSSCTIFAIDIWTHMRNKASELELMVVGRLFVLVMVAISVIWVPVLQLSQGAKLYIYIQEVSSYLQPPICSVFVLAILWSRLNEKGAFFSLVVGMAVGVARFAVQYSYSVPNCNEDRPDPTPSFIKDFHYLYFSAFLFVLTGLIAVVISLLTEPIDPKCIQRLTFWTQHSKEPRVDIDTFNKEAQDPEQAEIELRVLNTKGDRPTSDGVLRQLMDDNTGEYNESRACKLVMFDDVVCDKSERQLPWYRRIIKWVCGLDNVEKNNIGKKQVQHQDMLSIEEDRRWKIVTNVAAVFAMLCVIIIAVVFG